MFNTRRKKLGPKRRDMHDRYDWGAGLWRFLVGLVGLDRTPALPEG